MAWIRILYAARTRVLARQGSHPRSQCKRYADPTSITTNLSMIEADRSKDATGARRMPWRRKPMKGAASRDSPGGGAHGRRSRGARMGEPGRGHARPPAAESIGGAEATRGTETSKYPEEEKSTEIAPVAASERARCPNPGRRHSVHALPPGGCGARDSGRCTARRAAEGRAAERHGKAGRRG